MPFYSDWVDLLDLLDFSDPHDDYDCLALCTDPLALCTDPLTDPILLLSSSWTGYLAPAFLVINDIFSLADIASPVPPFRTAYSFLVGGFY